MRAYKGFEKNKDSTLWCLDFQYEVGKTYTHEGKIELCESGFHACHDLHQVWCFYPNNGNNVFYEVECGGEIIESEDDDGKFVCSEIRLVKEIDMTDVAKFEDAWDFYEGFAVVILNGKRNFIDTKGKPLSEKWYDEAYSFYEGFAQVKLNGKWNYINTEGKLLSEQWYDDAYPFHEGFAHVKLDGKCNFIDMEGKLLSEQWYDWAGNFHEGFAVVELNNKNNFIDNEGNLLSGKWYDFALDFSEGFALLELHRHQRKNSVRELVR